MSVVTAVLAAALAAPALTGTAPDCAPGSVGRVWPPDGAVVPPDVRVLLEDPGRCGLPDLHLVGPGERDVPLRVESGDGFVALVPDAPLAEGPHHLDAYAYDSGGWETATTFVVAADAPAPAPPAEPDAVAFASVERTCDPSLTSAAVVVVTLPDGEGYGAVVISVRTEAGEQDRRAALPATSLEAAFPAIVGGTELCAVATGLDGEGAVVWETAPVCAEPFEGCGEPDLRDPEAADGCGCAHAGPGAWTSLAAALLLAVRRRRR